MEANAAVTTKELTLPVSIANKADVGRIEREVAAVNEFLEQAAIRQPGTAVTLPKMTKLMEELVSSNKLNLLVAADRKRLLDFLTHTRDKAPELHMSFSAEPSPTFMQKLTTYVRENIHPQALIQIGLQPTIGAGFMLRTTNKYYDFSLRTALKSKNDILMQQIRSTKEAAKPATAPKEEV